ncbi:MAG: hypothetical protein J1F69_05905 [Clostridiales bacterium]|nr:hypothetical protein [Clostridiales bacterium]
MEGLFLASAIVIAALIVWTAVRTFLIDKELISKRNLFYMIPAFLLIYFLYVTGMNYNAVASQQTLGFFDYFHLVSTSLDVFGFKIQQALINPIASEYSLFYADFVIAQILCVLTGILSIASFFSVQIRNFIKRVYYISKGCDIVIGDCESAIKYAKNNKGCILWCENMPRARYFELLKDHVTACRFPLTSKRMAKKLRKGEHHLIVFKDAGYSYSGIIDIFHKIKGKERSLLYLHLEADAEETKIIKEKFIPTERSAYTFVTCFDKHELLARRFIKEYPISKYIPREFFDDDFALLPDKTINVVFVGFGKVNYELFKLAAMQFQFAKKDGKKLGSSLVNYHIYDTAEKRLHNEYFSRFKFEFDRDFGKTDFPKPEKICNTLNDKRIDIHSVEARKEFCELVNKNSFTYFIVSLSGDLEDASYAHTLNRMVRGTGPYKIFVRAKNDKHEALKDADEEFTYFGADNEVYSHDCIVDDDLMTLARINHILYEAQKDDKKELAALIEKIKGEPNADWNSKLKEELKNDPTSKLQIIQIWEKINPIEQFSNIYSVLNLPFKLGLMGLSLKKKTGDEVGIDYDEYCKLYRNPYMSRDCDDPNAMNQYNNYNFFFGTQPSNVLAYVEHARWNAYYILSDFKQMSKEDMKKTLKDGKMAHKDVEKKLQACITTHAGLDELIRFKYAEMYPQGGAGVKKDGTMDEGFQKLSSLYAYDYTNLDKVYMHLLRLGYIIVEN